MLIVVPEDLVYPVWTYQLNGASTEQSECVARRYVKALSPSGQDGFVVREQSLKPRLNLDVFMLRDHERHRE